MEFKAISAIRLWGWVCLAATLGACSTTTGVTPEQKREHVSDMRYETLAEFYVRRPDLRQMVDEAPGYAVFSDVQASVVWAGAGGGYGVVFDNRNGREVFMRMIEAGAGAGVGIKDYRALLVFRDGKALDQFLEGSWDVSSSADIAVVSDAKGVTPIAESGVIREISLFQLTETGVMAQMMVMPTRYWPWEELNAVED